MKKIKINISLRPAVPSDVFSKNGLGKIFDDREFFYKEKEGSISGPTRISVPFPAAEKYEYENLFRLMEAERILVIDPKQYLESIPIHLTIKEVEIADVCQNNLFIINTAYFLKTYEGIAGPFYIDSKTPKDFFNWNNVFVFDKTEKVKVIKKASIAEAV